jgi:hypothetical protein
MRTRKREGFMEVNGGKGRKGGHKMLEKMTKKRKREKKRKGRGECLNTNGRRGEGGRFLSWEEDEKWQRATLGRPEGGAHAESNKSPTFDAGQKVSRKSRKAWKPSRTTGLG